MRYYFILLAVCVLDVVSIVVRANFRHLIVLSHGMMGTFTDLNYLEQLLQSSAKSDDIKVFKSARNKYTNSLKGIQKGSEELAAEIIDILNENNSIETISFVGNSLGGIYARFAISLLYDSNTNSFINDIKPLAFVTIASPHLGVNYGQNYIEGDLQYYVPDAIKHLISSLFSATGQDMFMFDEKSNIKNSILYKLATENKFLLPLQAFKHRRLYANLQNDLMVTLPTASFMAPDKVIQLRSKHKDTYGIVDTLHTTSSASACTNEEIAENSSTLLNTMRANLDNLGWSKVIVNFKNGRLFGVFPLAHNKIAALTKFPLFFWSLFHFNEGSFVMEDLAQFLQKSISNTSTEAT